MKSHLRNFYIIILISFCLFFMTSFLQNNVIVIADTPAEIDVNQTIATDNEESLSGKIREYNIQLDRNSPFYSVLFESGTFLCADQGSNNGKRLKITEVGHMVSQEGFFIDVLRYALVDIDKDGEKELLLDLDHYNGTVILKASDDEICGYYLWYRWMKNIKDTGDFWMSGGMAGGTGKISFLKTGYETENVLYYEVKEFENRIAYTYNGVSITEEEYQQRLAAFEALPEPEWFEYWRSE